MNESNPEKASLQPTETRPKNAVVIGGGPAGLMAAEVLVAAGVQVDLYDAMPSVGRKLLLAGIGGLNITHSEDFESFCSRYGARQPEICALLADFDAAALRDWVHALGISTFVGTSGRVFPAEMKAAPLLRAWLHRLREAGVRLHRRHRFIGWTAEGMLCFATPQEEVLRRADAVVLALGGASWPHLGSDGAWVAWLHEKGVELAPLQAANCGFESTWSEHFRHRFAGAPVKPVAASYSDSTGRRHTRKGEFVVTADGIEGSLVYAISAELRESLNREGEALLHLDLAPDRDEAALRTALENPKRGESFSNLLRKRTGLDGVKAALLREVLSVDEIHDPARLASAIKQLPLRLNHVRPLAEAISTAGGVRFEALDEQLMLKALPGVFCAGEMLDWEAPTGGYLLTACFASGRRAGQGALRWLQGGASA